MTNKDKCLDLSVIPQFGESCWFNAILTIALYSQNIRKVLIKVAKKWNKTNKFLMIIKSILIKYYKEPSKIQGFFNKIKPEIILFKMLETYNEFDMINDLKYNIKNNIANVSWFENYIIKFFKFLNINCLDIIYINGRHILNFDNDVSIRFNQNTNVAEAKIKNINENTKTVNKRVYKDTKKILKKIPDIIIVIHEDLNIFAEAIYLPNLNIRKSKIYDHYIYKCKIKGIKTYDDIITVNGYKYKLDATTLTNYNEIGASHAIAGITCNNNRYVYNGWQDSTIDPAFKGYNNRNNNSSPCSLMKYDWNLKKDDSFCLNHKTCKLDFLNPYLMQQNLCFSFGSNNNRGRRFLIYVRIKDNKNLKLSEEKANISIPNKLKISNMSGIIKNMHDIKNLSNAELILALNKNGIYLAYGINYTREMLESLYYDSLKKYYNITSSSIKQSIKKPDTKDKLIKQSIKKPDTKDKLIKQILLIYPKAKNLKTKTHEELKKILKYIISKKNIPKNKKKSELIDIINKKLPKLTKSKLEQIISIF